MLSVTPPPGSRAAACSDAHGTTSPSCINQLQLRTRSATGRCCSSTQPDVQAAECCARPLAVEQDYIGTKGRCAPTSVGTPGAAASRIQLSRATAPQSCQSLGQPELPAFRIQETGLWRLDGFNPPETSAAELVPVPPPPPLPMCGGQLKNGVSAGAIQTHYAHHLHYRSLQNRHGGGLATARPARRRQSAAQRKEEASAKVPGDPAPRGAAGGRAGRRAERGAARQGGAKGGGERRRSVWSVGVARPSFAPQPQLLCSTPPPPPSSAAALHPYCATTVRMPWACPVWLPSLTAPPFKAPPPRRRWRRRWRSWAASCLCCPRRQHQPDRQHMVLT